MLPRHGWNFSGWSGQCTGTGPCNLTMLGNYGVSAYFLQPGSGLQFSSVTPCRLIDTRQTNDPIQGGTSQNFTIPQLGGCNIPASASAYSLNVTVVPHGSLGYLTVWPAGLAQPLTSTMNSRDGRTKASAVIVQAGTSDAISIYASNTTDVMLDINGYFSAPGAETYQYYPLTPCRVIDTRNADGPLAGPPLIGGQERDFSVEVSTCIPSGMDIQAYSFNVTVVPYPSGQPLRYLTVWPQGETQPHGFDLEQPHRDDRGQRGHRARRSERRASRSMPPTARSWWSTSTAISQRPGPEGCRFIPRRHAA